MKFLTLRLTKKKKKREREREREGQKHNPTSKTLVKLLKIFSLVTNYHELSLLPLVVRH